MKISKFAMAIAALTIAPQSQSLADSFASVKLDINSFVWSKLDGTPLANFGDPKLNITQGYNTKQNLITYSPNSSAIPLTNVDIIAPGGGAIPFTEVCMNASGNMPCPAALPTYTAPATSSYAYNSFELNGALINLDIDNDNTQDIAAGVTANSTAEASLTSNNPNVGSNSTLGTSTTIDFVYTGSNTPTKLSLKYNTLMIASVASPFGASDKAHVGMSWSFNLTSTAGSDIGTTWKWNPDELQGTLSALSGNGTLSISDQNDAEITYLGSRNSNGQLTKPLVLVNGSTYSLSINHHVEADVIRNYVPEPDSLALLGIGLIGFAAPKLRIRKARIL